MAALQWDVEGQHYYETGVSKGVLYPWDSTLATPGYGAGVAWNGLTGITESPSGADSNPIYADNIKYLDLRSVEEFGCTIEAYTYPDEWAECDGSSSLVSTVGNGLIAGQQPRKKFGLCYRTELGNDTVGSEYGYKLHLIYGCTASPAEKGYQTINDSPEAITFSWEVTTVPVTIKDHTTGVAIAGCKPTSVLTIDSTKFTTTAQKAALAALEAALYGDASNAARLPLPGEVISLLTPATSP